MRVLITGGSGFLGRALTTKFEKLGHQTFDYDIAQGFDICNKEQFSDFVKDKNPDVVVHLAAIADLYIFDKNPEVGDRINIGGTRNILDVCQKEGVRLLFASTCCCYGNNGVENSDETSVIAPTEPYSRSKAASEKDILKVGLPHCCMRLSTFYGADMRLALAPATFMNLLHKGETLKIHGDGKQTRNMTYVDDVVNGIVTIATTEPKYEIVNVVSRDVVSVIDMAEITADVMGKRDELKMVHVDDRDGQIMHEDILNDRLQSLGWKSETNFRQGMEKAWKFFQDNGYKFNC